MLICVGVFHPCICFASAEKEIIRVTDKGIIPAVLELRKRDSSVFIYNDTDNEYLGVQIEFGKNRLHCHDKRLQLDATGMLRTTDPIPPHSFVVACFPDTATYPITVWSSGNRGQTLRGEIHVGEARE